MSASPHTVGSESEYLISLAVIPEFIFRKVYLKGRWDHKHTMLLGPRVREGAQGYNVVTPLIRADGSTVLVDRGFVLKDHVENGAINEATGEVELLGMIRTSQNRNSFTPDNHPEKGEWYWIDVEAMADYAGGEMAGVQPVFIEEIFGECATLYPYWRCLTNYLPQRAMQVKPA